MSEVTSKSSVERIFLGLTIALASGIGGAFGMTPFAELADGAKATATLFKEQTRDLPEILQPIYRPGEGLVASDPSKSNPGYTLVQGLMPGGQQIRMIDPEGNEVHRWNLDFFKAWPDADEVIPTKRIPASQIHYFNQGMWPLADGSIIVNFTALGAVRVDACSNVMWRSDRPTHHSVTPTADGKFWIPSHIEAARTPREYTPDHRDPEELEAMITTDHYYHDSMVLVTADGEVEREISILKAVIDAGLEGALYQSHVETITDATHLNDINIVTPELAARIDGVKTGDLLVSLRAMNMIAILDQETGELKWYEQGAWVRQHDPDILPDGTIELFNNRAKFISGPETSSQIVHYDPATRQSSVAFPKGEADHFYTMVMGTHQQLDNGNRLITESLAGRAFEVTPAGEVVWDYRLPYDEGHSSLFSSGMRVPLDYFEKDALQCS